MFPGLFASSRKAPRPVGDGCEPVLPCKDEQEDLFAINGT
jgi:hypothetical protein